MRISSGRLKGRKILFPSSVKAKPTEGVVKEALISILRPYLGGMVFLDLFAGSGAVGLEAYSNGAQQVVFVEKDRRIAEDLKQTLTQVEDSNLLANVFVGDYRRYLSYFHQQKMSFDAVFVDPPYHVFSYSHILHEITASNLINSRGWIMVERHYRSPALKSNEIQSYPFFLHSTRKYGSVCLDIYRMNVI